MVNSLYIEDDKIKYRYDILERLEYCSLVKYINVFGDKEYGIIFNEANLLFYRMKINNMKILYKKLEKYEDIFESIPEDLGKRYKNFSVETEKIYKNKYIICLKSTIQFKLSKKISYDIYDSKSYKKFCEILDHQDLLDYEISNRAKVSIGNREYIIVHYKNKKWIEENYKIIQERKKYIVFRSIKKTYDEVQLKATGKNKKVIQYIKKPSKKV